MRGRRQVRSQINISEVEDTVAAKPRRDIAAVNVSIVDDYLPVLAKGWVFIGTVCTIRRFVIIAYIIAADRFCTIGTRP